MKTTETKRTPWRGGSARTHRNQVRADRIRTALKLQTAQDHLIASNLKAAKDEMSTDQWLAWCSKEFGWGKAMSYRRLDPAQMQDDRDDKAERYAAESRDSRQPEPQAEPRQAVADVRPEWEVKKERKTPQAIPEEVKIDDHVHAIYMRASIVHIRTLGGYRLTEDQREELSEAVEKIQACLKPVAEAIAS